jgi:hypothetical protein
VSEEDCCLIHGYEHMRKDVFDPIARCLACERERTEPEEPCDHYGISGFCVGCGERLPSEEAEAS